MNFQYALEEASFVIKKEERSIYNDIGKSLSSVIMKKGHK